MKSTGFSIFVNMDNDEKWKYLIELARNNKANFEKDDKWLVKGSGIKLYLKPTYNFGRIFFDVCTDDKTPALISLGLGVYLCNFFNGKTPSEILAIDPNWFVRNGFTNGLTPTRQNGFASILNQMRKYAEAYSIMG